jgi:predicted GIY-YIG superfamily endonuclease
MNTRVELLASIYDVVIRRFRAMRPVHHAYRRPVFLNKFVQAGFPQADVESVTRDVEHALMALHLDDLGSTSRVAVVNETFVGLGLPEEHLSPLKIAFDGSRRRTSLYDVTRVHRAPAAPASRVDEALASVEGEGQHLVYKLFDAMGALLYVGITHRGPTRLAEHYRRKSWFNEVVRVEFERFKTREICAAREAFLIKALSPRHNIQHNGSARAVAV